LGNVGVFVAASVDPETLTRSKASLAKALVRQGFVAEAMRGGGDGLPLLRGVVAQTLAGVAAEEQEEGAHGRGRRQQGREATPGRPPQQRKRGFAKALSQLRDGSQPQSLSCARSARPRRLRAARPTSRTRDPLTQADEQMPRTAPIELDTVALARELGSRAARRYCRWRRGRGAPARAGPQPGGRREDLYLDLPRGEGEVAELAWIDRRSSRRGGQGAPTELLVTSGRFPQGGRPLAREAVQLGFSFSRACGRM
jgi:hypothetical protein